MKENKYQSNLIKKIKKRFDGCMVLKNDPNYIRGIPDLLVLHNGKWAALECKKDGDSNHQPLQDYYISKMDDMSFASFICPENEEEVLDGLESTFND